VQQTKVMALLSHPAQQAAVSRWSSESNTSVEQHVGLATFKRSLENSTDVVILFGWNSDNAYRSAQTLECAKQHIHEPAHIIVLSDQDPEDDIVTALNLGADRFITHDVPTPILDAMITSVSKRVGPCNHIQRYSPYRLNLKTLEITARNYSATLTPIEFRIAQYLFEHSGTILTRAQLLKDVWDIEDVEQQRRVDTKMSHVRSKMRLDGKFRWRLKFKRHQGYVLDYIPLDQDEDDLEWYDYQHE